MRALERALALSAALWLVAASVVADVAGVDEALPPAQPLRGLDDGLGGDLDDGREEQGHQQQRRHLDVPSILDPAGMVSHFGETLGQAGRVLGLRIADSVADLVSSAFGHVRTAPPAHALRPSWTRGDPGVVPASASGPGSGPYYQQQLRQPPPPPPQPPSMLGGILRLLGLDSSKLGAIALNGVIFLAQLISSSIIGRPGAQARSDGGAGSAAAEDEPGDEEDAADEPAGTPLSWMLDNPAIKDSSALRDAQSPGLAERLVAEIQQRFPRPGGRRARSEGLGAPGAPGAPRASGASADTSCIQLLVCRAGPFLDGMQRSLRHALRPDAPSGAPSGPGAHKMPRGDPGDPMVGGQRGPGQQAAEEVEERWRRMTPLQRMFAHMPSAEEVLDRAHTCAQRFPNCKVSY